MIIQMFEGKIGYLLSHYHSGPNCLWGKLISHKEMRKWVPGQVSFDKEEGKKIRFSGSLEWCWMEIATERLWEVWVVMVGNIMRLGESYKGGWTQSKEIEKDFIYLFFRNLTVFQYLLSPWRTSFEKLC